MEVNKEQAEICRDLGAEALRQGDFNRAIKMLNKSLKLYPLPGVEALLGHAQGLEREQSNSHSHNDSTSQRSRSSGSSRASGRSDSTEPTTNTRTTNGSSTSTAGSGSAAHRVTPDPPRRASSAPVSGADGRAYTEEQVAVVKQILRAKEGGRGAHYRVLGVAQNCTEADLKKAYRKISLKVHPDKNSAPHADEAFKAVGLAYATLSDPQKRTIYDRYGDEDPDNRGGSAAGPGGMHMRPGQEVSPEEIFNMFFGGGMPGMHAGGPGFHVYSTGFGPGMQFHTRRRQAAGAQQNQQQQQPANGINLLFQFLPLLLILLVSFFRFSENDPTSHGYMPGEGRYFSLTHNPPFTNPLTTRLAKVKDIPYFVTDKFKRTYFRDRYQLAQVELMVERAYENYLVGECQNQQKYKHRLQVEAGRVSDAEEKQRKLKVASEFELTRCVELDDLFPRARSQHGSYQRHF